MITREHFLDAGRICMDKPKASATSALPEFVDAKGVRAIFGICRSHAYELVDAGKIRSLAIRRPGAVRGRRLFDCASLRAYLSSLCESEVAS